MPMIVLAAGAAEARTQGRRSMRVVESDKPLAVGAVQRERVAQSVPSFRRRLDTGNLEFKPVAVLEMMYAAIERQQEFECVFVGNGAPFLLFIS